MEERDNRMDAEEPFDFASLFAQEDAPSEAPAGQQEEQRSLASTLFAKLRSFVSPGQAQDSAPAGGEQGEPEAQQDEEPFPFGDEGEESPSPSAEEEQPQAPAVSDAEVQAAATAITDAIKSASQQFGVELSDERALEVALQVLGQATSLEQAELLIFGIIAKEAQKQGVNVKRQEQREFAGSSEDTLDLFVRLAS